jgi:hypothetical protein
MFIYAGVTFSGAMFMLSFTFYNEEGFMFYVVLFVLLGIVVLLLVIGMLTYRVYFYHNKMVIRRFGIFMKEYSLNMIKKDVTTVASGRALYAFKFKYRIEEKGSKEELKTFKIIYVDRGLCEYLESIGYRVHGKEVLYVKTNWWMILLLFLHWLYKRLI